MGFASAGMGRVTCSGDVKAAVLQTIGLVQNNPMVLPLGEGCIKVTPIGLPGQDGVKPPGGCAKGMQFTPLSLPYPQAAGHIAACASCRQNT